MHQCASEASNSYRVVTIAIDSFAKLSVYEFLVISLALLRDIYIHYPFVRSKKCMLFSRT